jgi:hypothetical protein
VREVPLDSRKQLSEDRLHEVGWLDVVYVAVGDEDDSLLSFVLVVELQNFR